MKKLLILAAILGGYLYFKKDTDDVVVPKEPVKTNDLLVPNNPEMPLSIFDIFDGRIINDSNNFWIYIKDGKLFAPSEEFQKKWDFDTYPVIAVNEDIWKKYGSLNPEILSNI